jgi:DNA-binding GntR family transcriptional regulator
VKFGLPDHKSVSDREHAALMRAVRKGDTLTAQKLLTAHLLGTGELLYRLLSESESGAAPMQEKPLRRRRARSSS